MFFMKRWIFAALFAFSAAAHTQNLADYEKIVTEHTMANGMHFIIMEDHTAPAVSFVIHVNTGSVDEKYGETGISHLIEHLAFNGTRKIGTRNWREEKKVFEAMDRVYEELLKMRKNTPHSETITLTPTLSPQGSGNKKGKGTYLEELEGEFERLNQKAAGYADSGEFGKIMDRHGAMGPNAYCSNDMTVFWVELPSNKTELWAMMESDRLFNSVFRGFYEELEVVKEERRMRVDNSPWGKLMEEFQNTAYSVHPYRNPVIGYPADLQEMTRRKVKGFYKKHYVPSNMTAVIAGDVNPKELIPLLEKYFGRVPAGERIDNFIPTEPAREKTERKIIVRMDSEPILMAGFSIPDINHPDMPALEACAEILAGGRTSRLHRRIVMEEKTGLSTGAWCRTAKYPGMFYVWAVAAKGHTNAELETVVYDEMEKMRQGAITAEELEGAKARLKMFFLTQLKERREMAEQLAWFHAITGNWRNLFAYLKKIDEVTPEDITAAMNKYLQQENRVVGMVERE